MKPEDLRLGNCVDYRFTDHPRQIKARDLLDAESRPLEGWQTIYKPISLTPEILEKCGFEEKYTITPDQDEINWQQLGELSIGDRGCQYDGVEIKQPEFLHQLQNLYFALTGTELNYTP